MYLAQDLINPGSLKDLSPLALLALVVIAFLWYMASQNRKVQDKITDVQAKVVDNNVTGNDAFIKAISSLTDIVQKQQTRLDKSDETIGLMSQGIDSQNAILKELLGDQKSANEWQRKLYAEIISISGDQGTAITTIGETITKQVEGTEATLMARLDSVPERVATRLTPTFDRLHTETLQGIKSAGKSIEDLFKSIIAENTNLRDEVEMKAQTITALNVQLSAAQNREVELSGELNRIKALTAPSDFATLDKPDPDPTDPPPTPVLTVNPETGDTEKRLAA